MKSAAFVVRGQGAAADLAQAAAEGLTLAEIGEILGVTESRVCQIHTKAVGGLRGQLSEVD